MLYTVKYGDTLCSVAEAHNMSTAELSALNQIDPHIKPVVGQSLIVSDDSKRSRTLIIHGSAMPGVGDMALMCAAPYLSYISISSAMMLSDGALTFPNDNTLLLRARACKATPLLKIVCRKDHIGNTPLHSLIQNKAAMQTLYGNIVKYISAKNYRGINFDAEGLHSENTDELSLLLTNLGTALKENGFIFAVTLPWDMPALTDIAGADMAIISACGLDTPYGPPLPLSPVDEMEKAIECALCAIPADKLLMELPTFGRNWSLPYRGGIPRTVYLCEAPALAYNHFADIRYDHGTQAPHFSYYDSAGTEHMVWFHDPRSLTVRLALAEKHNLGGVSWGNIAPFYRPGWIILGGMYGAKRAL